MKRNFIPALILLLSLFSVTAYSKGFSTYKEFYNSILQTPAESMINVSNFTIEKDAAKFTFESGVIVIGAPVDGMYRMAYFVGKGRFQFKPTMEIEVNQLRRYFNIDHINQEIKSVFFVCGDSLIYDLKSKFSPESIDEKTSLRGDFSDAVGILQDYKSEYIRSDVAHVLIDNRISRMFFSRISFAKAHQDFTYTCSPSDPEDITLDQINWRAGIGSYSENICMFPSTYRNSFSKDSNTCDDFKILKYTINSKIPNCIDMDNQVKIDAVALQSGFSWAEIRLEKIFDVDSVIDSKGNKCNFYKYNNKSYSVWINLGRTFKEGENFSFTIYYQGAFIYKVDNYTILSSSMGWYPNYGYKNKAFFDMTFETPVAMNFMVVGEKQSEEKKNDLLITKWKTLEPIRNASFQIGPFQIMKSKDTSVIPITLYYLNGDMRKYIMEDLVGAYKLYTSIYGTVNNKEFNAFELRGGHGEAFPGLLHLSTYAFIKGDNTGQWESFVAHETAHQWWGISVDFVSYRDQWLSEAFANYSSYMYFQSAVRDNKKFLRFFEKSRKELINKRKSWIASGISTGPVALGYRNSSSSTGNDYQLVVYEKGAWVLHMLRNIFIDLKTMKDDAFFATLKDFYTNFKGKEATTEDFRKTVEKYAKTDLKWFFDQWVYQANIPKYTFGWKVEPTADGKYLIKMRVKQEGVDSTFKMPIPLNVDFGGDRHYPFRVYVTGKVAELVSAPMPLKPKDIEFNYLESVLCDYDTADYDDIK